MIDNYFRFFHNQPYSFFDEDHLRQQFRAGLLPSAVQYAMFAIAFRFSQISLINENPGQAQCYADMGWSAAMAQCFGNDEGPDYRMVQALTLLAIYDFIGNLLTLTSVLSSNKFRMQTPGGLDKDWARWNHSSGTPYDGRPGSYLAMGCSRRTSKNFLVDLLIG
jgi:hypothetical protein